MYDTESFSIRIVDGIAHISLCQPDRGNPFDLKFNTDISSIAAEIHENRDVRCVLVDAQGKYFSVGADLKALTADRSELPGLVMKSAAMLNSALSRLTVMNAPVVVAVHSLAVGGAVSLCAAADFCLAARSASFYAGYTGVGLVPDGGGTTFVPQRVGHRRATEFLMRNETWTAERAQRAGLVNYVVDDEDLKTEAWALARELASGPTLAFGETKTLLQSVWQQPVDSHLEQEARALARVIRSDDSWNAMTAILRRSTPRFEAR
jgi:2-(1,2-epoxy-1,2-dihydrophenyl)acetyl-CoA isomerase